MKYAVPILILIVSLFGCASDGSKDTATLEGATYDLTSYEGLSAALEDGVNLALYDVRTEGEYVSGHIPGAINIPYEIIAEEIQIEEKDALIVVYCRSGSRSARAKESLENEGYTNVVNFGGVIDWEGELVTGMLPGGKD